MRPPIAASGAAQAARPPPGLVPARSPVPFPVLVPVPFPVPTPISIPTPVCIPVPMPAPVWRASDPLKAPAHLTDPGHEVWHSGPGHVMGFYPRETAQDTPVGSSLFFLEKVPKLPVLAQAVTVGPTGGIFHPVPHDWQGAATTALPAAIEGLRPPAGLPDWDAQRHPSMGSPSSWHRQPGHCLA